MDYGSVISNSFEYTRDALVGKWMQWIILAVLALVQTITFLLIPLLCGYVVRVLAGNAPAPEVNEWGRLFVDGWKMNIIALVYMIPIFVIIAFLMFLTIVVGDGNPTLALGLLGIGLLLMFIVAIIMAFILPFALVRFAHTDSVNEAFNISAILSHIGQLGWGTWIIAVIVLIVVAFVYGFVVGIIGMIPLLGFIITLFLNVAFAVFYGRYLALVYEDTPAPA